MPDTSPSSKPRSKRGRTRTITRAPSARAMGKSRPPASEGASAPWGRHRRRDASQPMKSSACDGWMSRPSMSTAKPTRTPVMLSRKGRHAGTSKNAVTISRHGVSLVQVRSVTPKSPRACAQMRAIPGSATSGRAMSVVSTIKRSARPTRSPNDRPVIGGVPVHQRKTGRSGTRSGITADASRLSESPRARTRICS